MRDVLFGLLALLCGSHAMRLSFTNQRSLPSLSSTSVAARGPRMASDGEDEIAALEARLAELKRTEESKQYEAEAAEAAEAAGNVELTELDEGGFDFATLSSRRKVAAIKTDVAPAELLSEAWKESTEDGEQSLDIGSIVKGLIVVVALAAFSQVPIGQDVDPATYGGVTPQPPSASEIRSLYEGGGDDAE